MIIVPVLLFAHHQPFICRHHARVSTRVGDTHGPARPRYGPYALDRLYFAECARKARFRHPERSAQSKTVRTRRSPPFAPKRAVEAV
eukprot:4510861-Prymnesium_polylepis.1